MSSELELLKQRITELEAENTELRKENTEISYLRNKLSVSDAEIAELKRRNNEFLRANKEYNERRDAENAKLKAENVEFRDRLTKVEQKQTLQSALTANDNSSNNSSSSLNSVAVPEAIMVPTNSAKRLNGKPLEEKDMDSFLLEAHKKIVSSEIKQRNNEKKLKKASSNQDQESNIGLTVDNCTSDSEKIPEVYPVTKTSEVTDILTSEQNEQDLSQSYEASSESIRSASCVLSKQPQVSASKLECNLENREESSRSESCDNDPISMKKLLPSWIKI
jgi:hypothetical protein